MKIYISADIEGVAGIASWDETMKSKLDNQYFCNEMSMEVQAACEGANNAGAKEIWVNDAHDEGRNISIEMLPENVKIIRSFSGHPLCMMQELDDSFDAILMIGYHSYAGSDESPLAHTMEPIFSYIKINGEYASEFLINAYTASLFNLPVAFASGDKGLCQHVKSINSDICTVETNQGIGASVISIHPRVVFKGLKDGVKAALSRDLTSCIIPLPECFEVELCYNDHTRVYKSSFYPGMQRISESKLMFRTQDYFEILRMLTFV